MNLILDIRLYDTIRENNSPPQPLFPFPYRLIIPLRAQ